MKNRRRKARKRNPNETSPDEADPELIDLARTLDEYRAEKNVLGWFSVPWNDGWNAVGLALDVVHRAAHDYSALYDAASYRWLSDAYRSRESTLEVYSDAHTILSAPQKMCDMLKAGLRCLQIRLSHSDGGGQIYNDLLSRSLTQVDTYKLEGIVTYHRRLDVIGSESGEKRVRASRAFDIAWSRGLFRVAYALGNQS